jgi:hypothetical protein
MEWAAAWIGRKEPPAGKIGFLYMLEGGTDASNTDPHATGPAPGNNWVETGPHVMIVGAKGMTEGYPREPLPNTKAPYVMWAGTPALRGPHDPGALRRRAVSRARSAPRRRGLVPGSTGNRGRGLAEKGTGSRPALADAGFLGSAQPV